MCKAEENKKKLNLVKKIFVNHHGNILSLGDYLDLKIKLIEAELLLKRNQMGGI